MADIFAFPVLHSIDGNWQKEPKLEYCGMTLRDYFAVKAMQSLIAGDANALYDPEVIAKRAYAMAYAMLKEREE